MVQSLIEGFGGLCSLQKGSKSQYHIRLLTRWFWTQYSRCCICIVKPRQLNADLKARLLPSITFRILQIFSLFHRSSSQQLQRHHHTMATPRASRSPSPVTSNALQLTPDFDLPTATLEFKEFSFEGEDGFLRRENVSDGHRKAFEAYLYEKYHVSTLYYAESFLFLGCEETKLPPEDERPDTIADLIAIWRQPEHVPATYQFGYRGQVPPVDTDPEILALIKPLEWLPDKAVEYLADSVFPTCEAISVLCNELVIDLPEMSDDEF